MGSEMCIRDRHLPPSVALALEGSTVVSLHGHLFDSGYINQALDTVEAVGARFDMLEVNIRPNPHGCGARKSSALLQITCDGGRPALEDLLTRLHVLGSTVIDAEVTIGELPDFCGGEYQRTLVPDDHQTGAPTIPATPPSARHTAQADAQPRNIVVLGAGMCSSPAIEYLSRCKHSTVHVVSARHGEAQLLCSALGRANVKASTLSCTPAAVDDWSTVTSAISCADAVLSLLPAPMHVPVADACITAGTPLVTASYISDEMRARSEMAKSAGVPILCEMGLDPGMDHMSAMSLIDAAKEEGGAITSFRSLCGGLPAPECADNPLLYKFSWSPAGVLAATSNSARYLLDHTQVEVPGDALLASATPLGGRGIGRALRLEVLPNRDSLPYGRIYGIDSTAHTIFRGTLRYEGWSAIFARFADIGLTKPSQIPSGVSSWPELLAALGVTSKDAACASSEALGWLGAFDDANLLSGATVRDAFCSLLEARLAYAESERDAVLLEHTLTVDYGSLRSPQLVTSSLIDFGDSGGPSSMSRTVGLTAAIGVQCLLDNPPGLPRGGIMTPTIRPIYEFALSRLADEGIRFTETISDLPWSASTTTQGDRIQLRFAE